MNELTYMKMIANEFGGLQKDDLLIKLERLVGLTRFNYSKTNGQHKTFEPVSKKSPEIIEKIEYLKDESYQSAVNKIVNSHKSDYVKMIDIIYVASRNTGIYPLDVFADINSLSTFFDFADKKGIEYSESHFFVRTNTAIT